MKKKNILIGFTAILFVIGSLILGLATNHPNRSSWKLGVGRVYTKSTTRSKWRGIEYWVDGIRYGGRSGIGLDGNIIGDCYEILINPSDFEEMYLLEQRPIFLKGEAVGEELGWIEEDYQTRVIKEYKGAFPKFMNYEEGYNHVSVEFFYKVNGKLYSRVQDFSVPLDSPLVFKKGMKFNIQYWLKNPQRSILGSVSDL